jgi:hypothetical protein
MTEQEALERQAERSRRIARNSSNPQLIWTLEQYAMELEVRAKAAENAPSAQIPCQGKQ